MSLRETVSLLLVEPDDTVFLGLRDQFQTGCRQSFQVERALNLRAALDLLSEGRHGLCLVADRLDDKTTAGDLLSRAAKANISLPFVLLADDGTVHDEALRLGFSDCLLRQEITPPLLERAICFAIDRQRMVGRIAEMTNNDRLTGLPNRTLFMDFLTTVHARKARSRGHFGLLFLDLDRFSRVNDTLGHTIGDRLLTEIAERLRGTVRQSDLLCRMGGDEFAVVLDDLKRPEQAAVAAQRFIQALAAPFIVEGNEVFVTCSIGICTYPDGATKPETLVRNADMAMYRAKDAGQEDYVFHKPEMMDRALLRLETERSLRRALEDNSFVLHYQPQIRLGDGAVVGAEALVRMVGPDGGEVQPDLFIAVAEETGLITDLGLWVLRTACKQNVAWQNQGLGDIRVAVNLSARQFQQGSLAKSVGQILKASNLPPGLLEVELTEGQLAEDAEQSVNTLTALRDMGVRVAIDDFGTGYSSLAYLKRFPLHTLKIDRSFVNDVTDDPDDAAIASAIIDLSRHLGLDVVAEGVETEAQRDFLQTRNCDAIQGFLISRPLPAEDFARWLHDYRSDTLAQAV